MSDPVTVHHQMKSHSDFLRAQPAVARFLITPAIIHIILSRLFCYMGSRRGLDVSPLCYGLDRPGAVLP
jgi:hypothetical protein